MQRVPLVLFLLFLASPALSSPVAAVTSAARDIEIVAEDDRSNQLYLWHPSTNKKELADFEIVLKWRINLTSRSRRFVDPVRVKVDGKEGTIWRIDISELQGNEGKAWKRATLDQARDTSVYFHETQVERIQARPAPTRNFMRYPPTRRKKMRPNRVPPRKISAAAFWVQSKNMDRLIRETGSPAPILHAQWFVANIAKELNLQNEESVIGYSRMLGVASRADLFELAGLDEQRAIRAQAEIRAALDKSKITGRKGRQVFKLDTFQGPIWGTLDTDKPSGRGVAINNINRGQYRHKAEEYLFHLPSGLVGMGLSSNLGARQNVAPDFVGQNTSKLNYGEDKRVHNGDCLTCHIRVLNPIDDYVRRVYNGKGTVKKQFKTKKEKLDFDILFMSNLDEALSEDIKTYERKVQLATVTPQTPKGLSIEAIVKLDAEVIRKYTEEDVTLAVACRDLGCTPVRLLTALKLTKGTVDGLDERLDPFVHDPPQDITRTIWEDVYAKTQYYLQGVP